MKDFQIGKCSTFLLQCIFTSTTPYMTDQMLKEIGYQDRSQAQKTLFAKAQALYDLGAERSQLCILQGSLILTSSYFSFGLDKDCRFWLSNAVRIATQMGLHRKHIGDQINQRTKKLFARVFWSMYSRDIVMTMCGRINVRAVDDRQCDVPEITLDDWEDEAEDELAEVSLPPISPIHKNYLTQSSKLAQICMLQN